MEKFLLRDCLNPSLLLGLLLAALLAALSAFLAHLPVFARLGLGALTLAIILGMIIGNTIFAKFAERTGKGIDFAKNKLLRLGIILYGFGVTLQEISGVGGRGIVIDIIMVSAVFFLGLFLGQRLLGLDRDSSILISAGSAICGAAAVMAAEPVLKAPAPKVAMAVATVVVFGTLSLFLTPLLYPYLGLNPHQFGIYIGSTVHEVAQVVAAGKGVSEQTAQDAVIVKMIRVMLLVPFLLLLSVWLAKRHNSGSPSARSRHGEQRVKIMIPWFALLFVLASIIASLPLLSPAVLHYLQSTGTMFLAMAMAALGLRTHYSALKQAGLKPLGLAFFLFLFLIIGGAVINLAILKF